MKNRILKYIRHAFIINATILIFVFCIQFIPFNFDFLDPIKQALEDFQLSDIVFRDFKTEEQDTNIVFVNIGFLGRAEIAKQIENIARFEPKVIGIDAIFEAPREPEVDSALSRVLQKYGQRIVLVNAFEKYNPETQKADSIRFSLPYFSQFTSNAYSNLDDRSFRTVRNFRPYTVVKGKTYEAFAVKIIEKYRPEKLISLKKRKNPYETINYRGNFDKYYAVIEAENALDGTIDFSFVKDKIVLFGYVNSDKEALDITDKFFTPMNSKLAGRSLPDMYGIVVHANILSMILNESYIQTMGVGSAVFWAFFLNFLNLWFLLFIYWHYGHFYDLIVRSLQLVQSLFFTFLIVWFFEYYRYETDFTLLMVALALAPDFLEFYMAFYEKYFHKQEPAPTEN